MIGKIMSEAAHSIIGMFSAKPEGMEQKASPLDFGSLMATPEQQPQATVDTVEEVGAPDQDERETSDAAAVPNWSAPIVLPAAIQNIGLGPWTRSLPSGTAEQQLPADETDILSTAAPIAGRHAALKPAIAAEPVDLVPSPLTQGDARPGVIFDARAPLATGETPVADDRAADEAQQSPLAARVQTSGADAAKLLGHGREEAKNKGTSPALAASLAISETVRPLAASLSPLMVKRTLQSPAQDEAVTVEPQLPAKAMDVAVSQPAMNSFSLTPPVRETVAGAASFDLSAPRLAERLAAEISELSASGGTKKFEINPRNLGRMEIIFTTRGSTEIIEIQTENRSAKDIIMQHSQVLQDMLKAQGREDLSLRIDVKDSMSSFAKAENGNLFQQDSRDAREQQARPGRPGRTLPVFDRAGESDSASDNSRYA